ncbi:hypothetical protein B0H13DRAFT_2300308 [Mycena leptocephala]|nr:hypothetical protein B0H13DRAFT_2300308 [Mycena leptocephala]
MLTTGRDALLSTTALVTGQHRALFETNEDIERVRDETAVKLQELQFQVNRQHSNTFISQLVALHTPAFTHQFLLLLYLSYISLLDPNAELLHKLKTLEAEALTASHSCHHVIQLLRDHARHVRLQQHRATDVACNETSKDERKKSPNEKNGIAGCHRRL